MSDGGERLTGSKVSRKAYSSRFPCRHDPPSLVNASESFKARNPHLYTKTGGKATYRSESLRRRGIMNKTETEYSQILEGTRQLGQIIRWEFEGITLRWADMRYTPDFIVFRYYDDELPEDQKQPGGIKLIEVKGPHIWSRDIVRFKGARAYWPEFAFEMWQKTKAGWKQKF